ncbi:MAG: hypothetical protein U1E36_04130 [Rickettsiales bacterium]
MTNQEQNTDNASKPESGKSNDKNQQNQGGASKQAPGSNQKK